MCNIPLPTTKILILIAGIITVVFGIALIIVYAVIGN